MNKKVYTQVNINNNYFGALNFPNNQTQLFMQNYQKQTNPTTTTKNVKKKPKNTKKIPQKQTLEPPKSSPSSNYINMKSTIPKISTKYPSLKKTIPNSTNMLNVNTTKPNLNTTKKNSTYNSPNFYPFLTNSNFRTSFGTSFPFSTSNLGEFVPNYFPFPFTPLFIERSLKKPLNGKQDYKKFTPSLKPKATATHVKRTMKPKRKKKSTTKSSKTKNEVKVVKQEKQNCTLNFYEDINDEINQRKYFNERAGFQTVNDKIQPLFEDINIDINDDFTAILMEYPPSKEEIKSEISVPEQKKRKRGSEQRAVKRAKKRQKKPLDNLHLFDDADLYDLNTETDNGTPLSPIFY